VAESRGAFARVLRELRTAAGLTQEELAHAAGVSLRSVSDLERGKVALPQQETVRLLADALHLIGPVRAQFEAVARGRAATAGTAATRTLPRDVAAFTGRQRELDQLLNVAAGAVNIHAIGGMAGVGKTAFAVHAGHRLADRFPGGQIFLPLHGHTPGQRPVEPEDALVTLLLTAGIPPGQIPLGLEARMALWRDRLASQELLLILDDAVGSEQVLPLLPGAGGSLVLVTSRRHLTALEDATAISLDILPPGEAAALLVELTGRAGLSAADPAVREIIGLCGFLPLAIGMVARQLRHHPAWSLARKAAELVAERDRLELMATENVSVAAAFDLSYADLVPDNQRLFRRLGLHPGSELDAYAAAALDGASLTAARRGLEALYDQYLLSEVAQGRYRMHDLIREYARALAGRLDPDDDREQATGRLLDYYQRTAARSEALIARQTRPARSAEADAIPAPVPVLNSSDEALAWARAERASLLACLDFAASTGQHARVVTLTSGIAALLRRDTPWAAAARHTAAVQAARYLGDRFGEADALSDLGDVQCLAGDFAASVQSLEQALDIYRDLGDRLGQANALHNLGVARRVTDDHRAAVQIQEQALGIFRDLGDRLGQANALHTLGVMWLATGDCSAAAPKLDEARDTYRDLGDRIGEAKVLKDLGVMLQLTGNYPAAVEALDRAQGIYRGLDYRLGTATVLTTLGDLLRLTGDSPAAVRALEEALSIHRDIGDRLGQANALRGLGDVLRLMGDSPAAVRALEEALVIYRDIGIAFGANALKSLGSTLLMMGDFPAAARALEEALAVYRDIGDRDGEAEALNERGTLHRISGELELAETRHQQALKLARATAIPGNEAHALAGLGRCALAASDATRAGGLLRQALEIFQRIGTTEAAEVAAELGALPA